jgi:hypothetical protein
VEVVSTGALAIANVLGGSQFRHRWHVHVAISAPDFPMGQQNRRMGVWNIARVG